MNKEIKVAQCAPRCPFYKESDSKAMLCGHPFWEPKPPGSNAIIAGIHRSAGVFPEQCPLRREALVVTYAIGPVAA